MSEELTFSELFEFAAHEREDVRKMALQGVAQHSRDNAALNEFLCRNPEKSIDVLLSNFNVQRIAVLGDVLSTLTNAAANTTVAEAMVSRKVVTRTIRLLDALEASSEKAAAPLKELALILLNNLTATHVTAIDDLLQLQDEDLRGFFLSKLCTLFDRQAESERDVQKWILQIILNVTRVPEAQDALLRDDEWALNFQNLLECENEGHRMLIVQACRNCASTKQSHDAICKSGIIPAVVKRVQRGEEKVETLQMMLVEFIAGMMQTGEGINGLEEINTKKLLQTALREGTVSSPEVVEFIQQHIMPFLDDVQDAYLMGDQQSA